jgi:hypothetical protein
MYLTVLRVEDLSELTSEKTNLMNLARVARTQFFLMHNKVIVPRSPAEVVHVPPISP